VTYSNWSVQANTLTHDWCNQVMLVWGSLRLAPISCTKDSIIVWEGNQVYGD